MGALAQHVRRFEQALTVSERALNLFREMGARQQMATALASLGLLYAAMDDPDRAVEYDTQAVKEYQELGCLAEQATVSENIATIYESRREFDHALECMRRGLVLMRELGNKTGEARWHAEIGQIYLQRREFQPAHTALQTAQALFRASGSASSEAEVLNNMALAYHHEGDMAQAKLLYAEAMDLARPLAGIRAAVETLRDGTDTDPEMRDALLAGVEEETRRLERLIGTLQGLHKRTIRPFFGPSSTCFAHSESAQDAG